MKRFTVLSLITLMVCLTAHVNAQTNSGTLKEPITLKVDDSKSFGKQPLYVVDGKIVNTGLTELSPDQIESFTILKNASAIAEYGVEGANGVILIKTKNKTGEKIDLNKIITSTYDTYGKSPILVLDGKIMDQPSINQIDPNKIESVSILKDASAIALYGKEAANGVIIIVTKKEEPSKVKN